MRTPEEEITQLRHQFPSMVTFGVNEFGAPRITSNSPFELGLALTYLHELGADANCRKLASLLSVTKLTCQNWIDKLREECLCDIQWIINGSEKCFVIHSFGIFNMNVYCHFRPYIRATISKWRDHNDKVLQPK